MMNTSTKVMTVVMVSLLAVVGCGKDKGDKAKVPAGKAISWSEAAEHVGQYVTVEGPVVSTYHAERSKGSPTFLNIGKPYPARGRFTVLIWGRDRDNFPGEPEEIYRGKTIRVTGVVETYKGTPEIVARSADQIEIVGQ